MQRQLNLKIVIEFQDLLRRMLDFDRRARITPGEAIGHPFFKTLDRLRDWAGAVVDARGPEVEE